MNVTLDQSLRRNTLSSTQKVSFTKMPDSVREIAGLSIGPVILHAAEASLGINLPVEFHVFVAGVSKIGLDFVSKFGKVFNQPDYMKAKVNILNATSGVQKAKAKMELEKVANTLNPTLSRYNLFRYMNEYVE